MSRMVLIWLLFILVQEKVLKTYYRHMDSLKRTDILDIPHQNLSRISTWTIGEMLYHMSLAPRFLSKDVKMITNQNWLYRIIPVIIPKQLFDWLNKKRNPLKKPCVLDG